MAGITDYASANKYLERIFVADFNRRFTVKPTESGSAFVPLVGMDLELVLSEQHERVVGKDSIVSFENVALQLPRGQERATYARCAVLVHRVLDDSLVVTHMGRVLARYASDGAPARQPRPRKVRAA